MSVVKLANTNTTTSTTTTTDKNTNNVNSKNTSRNGSLTDAKSELDNYVNSVKDKPNSELINITAKQHSIIKQQMFRNASLTRQLVDVINMVNIMNDSTNDTNKCNKVLATQNDIINDYYSLHSESMNIQLILIATIVMLIIWLVYTNYLK